MNVTIDSSATAVHNGNVPLPAKQRWFSLAEFLLGSAIVIGHNVYHVIPNEVPILFVLGLISIRWRDGSFAAMGLGKPVPWRRTILFALAAAATRLLLGSFVIEPLTAHFWPPAAAPSGMNEITGHWWPALQWFVLIWTFAAFGEEIGYRGYLLNRAADVGGRSKAAYWAAYVLSGRNLWVCILAHGFIDTVSVVFVYFGWAS